MKILLFIGFLFASLALGQFERLGFGIYLHDIILSLLIIFNIKNLRLVINDKTNRFGWYFIGFAFLSLLLNLNGKPLDSTIVAVSYLVRWTVYYLVFCLIIKNNEINDSGQARMTKWFNLSLLVYSVTVLIISLTQWLVFPDMRILSVLGWDDHYYRLIGNWLDPNLMGLILVLGLLYWSNPSTSSGLRWFNLLNLKNLINFTTKIKPNVIVISIFIVGILLTYSRSSYLALIIGVLFLFRWKVGLLISLSVGLLVLSYAFLVPKPAGEGGNLLRHVSVEARIRSYNRGIAIFKTSPLYGVGFNYYKYAQGKAGYIPTSNNINSASGNDNSFILIIATTGIIGLVLFLVFWIKLFIGGDRLVKASMAAITIHSFFNNSIFFPAVIIWLWMIISISDNSGNSINRVIKKTHYDKR